MKTLLSKLFNLVPADSVKELETKIKTLTKENNVLKGKNKQMETYIHDIPAKLGEMKLSRNLKKAIINKLNRS